MSNKRYPEEFRIEAVKQVTERKHPVAEVAGRPAGREICDFVSGLNAMIYPLREYLRPWKLATFALGMTWLIWGAFYYQFEDWDVGISLIMGLMAYLFAPWSISVFAERRWKLVPLSLFLAWLTIDGVYVGYSVLMGHWYPRLENFYASTCLYLLCGLIWLHKGDLRSILR